MLCHKAYGIDILKVQEIRSHEAVTKDANTQAYQGCHQFTRHHSPAGRYAYLIQAVQSGIQWIYRRDCPEPLWQLIDGRGRRIRRV